MDSTLLRRGAVLGSVALLAAVGWVRFAAVHSSAAPPAAHAESSAAAAPATGYVVGQWEGLLAVYTAGEQQPLTVYDIYIGTFPQEEQVRLTAGIPAADEVTLARLLEDYTS